MQQTWVLVLLLLAFSADRGTAATVTVVDGDTVTYAGQRLRLYGVDAPEKAQPYGPSATACLAALVAGGVERIEYVGYDSAHCRPVVRLTVQSTVLSGADVSVLLVERGCAWWYTQYAPHDAALQAAQATAQHLNIGLWALPADKRVAPWVWRKQRAQ